MTLTRSGTFFKINIKPEIVIIKAFYKAIIHIKCGDIIE